MLSQVEEFISKSEGSKVWKGLMKYMQKDWKEVRKESVGSLHLSHNDLVGGKLACMLQKPDEHSKLTSILPQAAKINILLCFMPVPVSLHTL